MSRKFNTKKFIKDVLRKIGLFNVFRIFLMFVYRLKTIKTERVFYKFLHKMPISSVKYNRKSILKNPPEFDIYMTGSDQTWNPRYLSRDYTFLLDFAPDDAQKISYSASFGSKEISEDFKHDYAELLKRYSSISVRESSGVTLLQNLTGQKAVHCVDPTLLLTAEEWREIADYSLCPDKPYILCYILNYVFNPYPFIFDLINRVRDELNMEVLFLTSRRNKAAERQGYICCSSAGPAEFLGLYDKASFVITTSFHGTAFSANFQKNFIAVTNPNASSDDRVTDFLSTLNLQSQGLKAFSSISGIDLPLVTDYSVAKKNLTEKRKESMTYLQRSITGNK